MLQKSVFHSELTPFNANSAVRNWPHQSCELGLGHCAPAMATSGWICECTNFLCWLHEPSLDHAVSMKSADLLFHFTYSDTYQGMTDLFAL